MAAHWSVNVETGDPRIDYANLARRLSVLEGMAGIDNVSSAHRSNHGEDVPFDMQPKENVQVVEDGVTVGGKSARLEALEQEVAELKKKLLGK